MNPKIDLIRKALESNTTHSGIPETFLYRADNLKLGYDGSIIMRLTKEYLEIWKRYDSK